jgi:hypothetical protein
MEASLTYSPSSSDEEIVDASTELSQPSPTTQTRGTGGREIPSPIAEYTPSETPVQDRVQRKTCSHPLSKATINDDYNDKITWLNIGAPTSKSSPHSPNQLAHASFRNVFPESAV